MQLPWNKDTQKVKVTIPDRNTYPLYLLNEDGSIEEMNRIDWDSYFMMVAEQVATRGTCDRKQVGCVLVSNKRIIATGYNGSMSGAEHCDDIDHLMENDHCVRTIHAELNAIAQCAKYGVPCEGATCYCNTLPCWNCFKSLVNAGIRKVFYKDDYTAELKGHVFKFSKELGIPVERL